MQKKSLLVALFCGALCLVGCIKNEESASVAQVRIAKANELNSIADLNKAKAAAEAVYAQAELVVAQAEAELRKAQANLVNAQAETEKVRAELLKVRVQLAEVTVDEEKIKLQLLEADLQKHLAEVEAAIAKAEAEKQGWIIVLQNAIAQSEVQAINNAKALLEAQAALEDYMLQLEGYKAEQAKKAAAKYFAALNEIQALQKEKIQVEATKALVEVGAKGIRTVIYDAIDNINEEIAKKEALVEYLKEHQTMTPEQAKEAEIAARAALTEAYNEYKAAVEAEEKVAEIQEALQPYNPATGEGVVSDFTENWDENFKDDIKDIFDSRDPRKDLYHHRMVEMTLGDETKLVPTSGIVVPSEENEEESVFIPFWNEETLFDAMPVRYPDTDIYYVQDDVPVSFVELNNTLIAPATIYYDNIKGALAAAAIAKGIEVAAEIVEAEDARDAAIQAEEDLIDEYEAKIALHEKYVAARAEAVETAEEDFLAELGKKEENEAAVEEAWKKFQEYMVLKTDVSREWFAGRADAQAAFDKAQQDSVKVGGALKTLKEVTITADKKTLVGKVEALAKAEGALIAAKKASAESTTTTALNNAKKDWNPDFDAADVKPVQTAGEDEKHNKIWTKTVDGNTISGGYTQNANLDAKLAVELKDLEVHNYQLALWRGVDGYTDAGLNTLKAELATAQGKVTNATTGTEKKEADAKVAYQGAYNTWKQAVGTTLENAKKAFNEEFPVKATKDENDFYEVNVVEGDTTWRWKMTGEKPKKGWTTTSGKVAGTTQDAFLDAVKNLADDQASAAVPTTVPTELDDDSTIGEAYAYYKKAYDTKKIELETANKKLIAAIKGDWTKWGTIDLKKNKIEDYIDTEAEALWVKYREAEAKTDKVNEAWAKLSALYNGFDPDEINVRSEIAADIYQNPWWDGKKPYTEFMFSWLLSNYNVDYNATVLNEDGDPIYIAALLYGHRIPPVADGEGAKKRHCVNSLQYKAEQAQNEIDVEIPEAFATAKANLEDDLKDFTDKTAEIAEKLDVYAGYEADYASWVAMRENAEESVNLATEAKFDAYVEYLFAQVIYDGAKALADEGMWVYDKDATIYAEVYGAGVIDPDKHSDDFTWITISDEIERLENGGKELKDVVDDFSGIIASVASKAMDFSIDDADATAILKKIKKAEDTVKGYFDSIAGLKLIKKVLEKTLSTGKSYLNIVIDAFDEEIAEIEEKIDAWTKYAEIYKAIMNAYLGIVDEAVVEEPIEGEDEE